MDLDTPIRIGALCLLLASAETLHGIARTVLVTPLIGKERAVKLSAVTGTALAFAICFMQVPGIDLRSASAHLALGAGLAFFMAAFDICIGRLLMHKQWKKIWPDFNPHTGNYLLFGLVCLCFMPLSVWYLRS
ncbi:MAG TPA: hypothetical protein VFW93_03770 [Aquabacterium sp.]|uniref:hypothetical protein n=1 Tax=Aquabacterium sp. TaxID=1872578 RepID=UPI002E314EE6|nr:hypothetical protein [Aquabacterium sp.]HEX5355310.1 hypothetical protein [Aquabacterium sp.]